MKILFKFVGAVFIGLLICGLLTSCAWSHKDNISGFTFLPGPVISGNVAYYPARPGSTYHNTAVDYTTNPPPAGAVTFVTVFSTNGLVIDLTDGNTIPDTNSTAVHFIKTKPDASADVSTSRSSPASDLY
jgi:hypothetical protein